MPQYKCIIGLPDLELIEFKEFNNFIIYYGKIWKDPDCPRCASKNIRIKDSFDRKLRYSKLGSKVIFVQFKSYKYTCKQCHYYFNLRLAGVLPKKQATESFRQDVFESHIAGQSQKYLSEALGISDSTVERWSFDFLNLKVKELVGRHCPKVLGIDEHFFTKKEKFATTLVDLKNHRVFDVVKGKSQSDLHSYLSQLQGKERVELVVMDLCSSYRALVKKYFPNAKIVADRFHVVRLINYHFLKTWQTLDPEGRKKKTMLRLMRYHEWNLNEAQRLELMKYLEMNPVMKILYEKKQELIKFILLKTIKKDEVKKFAKPFLDLVQEFVDSSFDHLKTLGKTITEWLEPIVRMWRFRKTNSITEGFHNKMEMISRRAFGFRNFNNYRIRVLALCGWNGLWTLRARR